jgi:N-methylhydantoinase A
VTPEAAALGVVRVANATMERALRTVSVERGYDPREFILLPFGGAGPLHACDLAAALQIRRILCPPIPGVLSAYGMLLAEVVREASQAILRQAEELLQDLAPLRIAFEEQQARVLAAMAAERVAGVAVTAALDMRYRGQSYELTVPLPLPIGPEAVAAAVTGFHGAHEQRYGYAMPGEKVEVVTLRVKASAPGPAVELPRRPLGGSSPAPAWLRRRSVWFAPGGPVEADVYERTRLEPGNRFAGPAVVLQYDATVVVAPGWEARVDEWGNLWVAA